MFTIDKLNGESIGGINLNSIDERNGTFSIGIVIDKEIRRQVVYINGQYLDFILFGLTKDEFIQKQNEKLKIG